VRKLFHSAEPKSRLKRLAASIDALAGKDERFLNRAHEVAEARCHAAAALHAICSDFVSSVNRLLSNGPVELDPPDFNGDAFRDDGVNLLQINVRGRILQIEFEATDELTSTEEFRVPYTLKGAIHCFNQELLDHNQVEEQFIFYLFERDRKMWWFFDARTYRSGPFDQDYLISLMEQLI
jgi:hypothetical protein